VAWKPEWMRDKIRVYDYPARAVVPAGIEPGTSIRTIQIPMPVVMELISYSSWDPVHGLFCVDRATFDVNNIDPRVMYFFFGYKCENCREVFLITNAVKTDFDLYKLLKHTCEVKGPDVRTS
jgi:hypothetical protein